MATPDKESDIERLLREADDAIAGRTPSSPARKQVPAAERPWLGADSLRVAVITAGVAAAAVWVAFALVPILGSLSGAAGAFLATFVVVLLLRRR